MAERTMAAWRSSPRIRVFMLGRHCRQQPIVTWGVGRRESDGTGAEAMRAVPRRGPAPEGRGTGQSEATSARLDVVNEHHLKKSYAFPDFVKALAFVNQAGAIAEEQGHHPDLYLSWGKVGVEIWTHKIDGLTESDFILAAKLDRIPR